MCVAQHDTQPVNELVAHCQRIAIGKSRQWRATCCECVSPMLLLLLLALGHALSSVVVHPTCTHAVVNIAIPPAPFQHGLSLAKRLEAVQALLSGPTFVPNLEEYLQLGERVRQDLVTGDAHSARLLANTDVGVAVKNLAFGRRIALAPAGSALVQQLIHFLNTTYPSFQTHFVVELFPDEHTAEMELISRYRGWMDNDFLALIVLRSIPAVPTTDRGGELPTSTELLDVVIRQERGATPNTNSLTLSPTVVFNPSYQLYLLGGFLSLKSAINDWIFHKMKSFQSTTTARHASISTLPLSTKTNSTTSINYLTENNEVIPLTTTETSTTNRSMMCLINDMDTLSIVPLIALVPFPTFAFKENPFFQKVGFLLGLALLMSWIAPLTAFAKELILDRESGLFQLMLAMGMDPRWYALSWIAYAMVLVVCLAWWSSWLLSLTLFPHAPMGWLFILFFLFGWSGMAMSSIAAAWMHKTVLMTIVFPICLLVMCLPRFIFLQSNHNEFVVAKSIMSLLSPTAFAFSVDIVVQFEYTSSTPTLFFSSSAGEVVGSRYLNYTEFNLAWCLTMLLVDCVVYSLIALICHARWRSCWWDARSELEDNMEVNDENLDIEHWNTSYITSQSRKNMNVCLNNVHKRFDSGVAAIKRLSIEFCPDEITCLLGHNGAGELDSLFILFR
jgi:ABC-type multidrug transport system fused ATPase/permease subunit